MKLKIPNLKRIL